MGKKSRFWIAVTAVALLLVPLVSTPVVLAAEVSPVQVLPAISEPKITLEEALTKVKENFEVPESYTEFQTSYSTYNNRQTWTLNWNATGYNNYGNFSAEVDAVNGDILYMRHWKADDQGDTASLLPAVSKEEAQKISDGLLTRLLGARANELELLPGGQTIEPLYNYGWDGHMFQYQRQINGIPFLNNGAYVQVSKTDGRIISYNLNWDEVKAPEAKGIIEENQAEKAFSAAPDFKLVYFQPPSYLYYAAGEKQQEVKLVYQLTGQNGGAIDAYTGEPLKLDQESYLDTGAYDMYYSSAMKEVGGYSSNETVLLTPQEQQEVELAAQLLKQEEAIAVVKKWLDIPANLSLRNVSLGNYWGGSAEQRYWTFEWSNDDPAAKGLEYLYAVVDATNGELASFQSYYQSTENAEATLDQKAAQNLAEEFLQKIQPEKFSQVKLADEVDNYLMRTSSENDPTKYFSYQRLVNGIDFPDNIMTVSVDTVSGRILSYNLNWSDSVLPGIAGTLSKEEGVKLFLQARPLMLAYVQPYTNGEPGNLRLVYLPYNQERSAASSNILDAKSGEFLDYSGQPLKDGPKPYIFTDLTGVDGAQEIVALGKAGLFGEFGNSFNPQEKIEFVSLLRAMYCVLYDVSGSMNLTDEEIMKKAKELEWVKEDFQPEASVSRELLAKLLLRYMSLGKLAEMKDIYQVQFDDADQISSDALGYVALACGSGILRVEGQILAPQEEVSRAEAALALFRALSWRYYGN